MTDAPPAFSRGAVETDPQLAHWIDKAAANPLHLPAMWRAMKHAELHAIVPGESGAEGEIELREDEALSIVTLEDGADHYAPVFTSLAEAEDAAEKLGEAFAVASAEGEPIFVMLANCGHPIVINPFSSPRIRLSPEIVHELATTGHVTRHTIETAHDHTKLIPVPSRDVPHDYLIFLRGRCAAHRRAIAGLYLFHPMKADALEPDYAEYRFMLRMHQPDEAFVREFKTAAGRGLSGGMRITCTVVTEAQASTLAFLDTVRPIWPV